MTTKRHKQPQRDTNNLKFVVLAPQYEGGLTCAQGPVD